MFLPAFSQQIKESGEFFVVGFPAIRRNGASSFRGFRGVQGRVGVTCSCFYVFSLLFLGVVKTPRNLPGVNRRG
jgi:hypothetical protein